MSNSTTHTSDASPRKELIDFVAKKICGMDKALESERAWFVSTHHEQDDYKDMATAAIRAVQTQYIIVDPETNFSIGDVP